jgi:hypothetical protein
MSGEGAAAAPQDAIAVAQRTGAEWIDHAPVPTSPNRDPIERAILATASRRLRSRDSRSNAAVTPLPLPCAQR